MDFGSFTNNLISMKLKTIDRKYLRLLQIILVFIV